MAKIMSRETAVNMIKDGNCVWVVSSGGGVNEPKYFLKGVEQSFLETGKPEDLFLCHSSGIGDKHGGGSDCFAHPGMVRKVIGSHWGWSPAMSDMAFANEMEAYTLPQGVMVQLTRQIAGKKPGLISHVGLKTFIDPRVEGGALNEISKAELSEVMVIDDKEYLFYKAFPIDVTIIRGTTADEDGNISMEQEGLVLESISAAQAAKNSGGIVIAQVKRLTKRGCIKPLDIKVPGVLVDAVVIDPEQKQSFITDYEPAFTGEVRLPVIPGTASKFDVRMIIGRRASMELRRGYCVNLGFGIPDTVAAVVSSEGVSDHITLSLEQGIVGGVPAMGTNFGLGYNPQAIIDEAYQFDWYDGGGLDIAFLSFAELDREGNVNVSKFNGRVTGVGGFINISQNAKRVVFMGTFTASGLATSCRDGRLRIEKEGKYKKLKNKVSQISFSGSYASMTGQDVCYVTERAVFKLTAAGVMLMEIAPGIDLQKDVLNQMEFEPLISEPLREMYEKIFSDSHLGLKNSWKEI